MKHLQSAVSLLLILSFFGCAVKEMPAMECVGDRIEVVCEPTFYLTAAIPQEATLTLSSDEGRRAVFSHEDYEITQEIFPADSADSALESLTGQEVDALCPIRVAAEPQEEYRFAWTAAGENGALNCSGALFFDGEYCYAVSIQCAAEKEKLYRDVFSELLSSVALQAV